MTRARGQALPALLVVLFVGLLVGAVRFLRLGDLSIAAKLLESAFWGLGTVVIGLIFSALATMLLSSTGAHAAPARRPPGARSVTPEELSAIESEMPERERPEFGGVHGRPPEEMAEMIRKMAGSDGL